MALDDPANYDNEGADVMFGDGHVDWVMATDLRLLLATTRPATRSHREAAP